MTFRKVIVIPIKPGLQNSLVLIVFWCFKSKSYIMVFKQVRRNKFAEFLNNLTLIKIENEVLLLLICQKQNCLLLQDSSHILQEHSFNILKFQYQ